MTEPTLTTGAGEPFAIGESSYLDNSLVAGDEESRVFVRIQPEGLPVQILAMVDTGASFCILEPQIGSALRPSLGARLDKTVLKTRFGDISGDLFRGRVQLLADVGNSLVIEATLFLPEQWPTGRNFLGYACCLERARFAVDPSANRFHFGPC